MKSAARGEQRHREHDLGRREHLPEALGRPGSAGLAGRALERRREIRPRAVQRGEQSEQHAGRRAKARPRPTSTAASTVNVMAVAASAGSSDAHRIEREPCHQQARRRRPWTASSSDSTSSWRTSCARLAPIDSRTAISVARLDDRTSSRFAMLAQAMSSTMPVTDNRMNSGDARFLVHRTLSARAGLDGDGAST